MARALALLAVLALAASANASYVYTKNYFSHSYGNTCDGAITTIHCYTDEYENMIGLEYVKDNGQSAKLCNTGGTFTVLTVPAGEVIVEVQSCQGEVIFTTDGGNTLTCGDATAYSKYGGYATYGKYSTSPKTWSGYYTDYKQGYGRRLSAWGGLCTKYVAPKQPSWYKGGKAWYGKKYAGDSYWSTKYQTTTTKTDSYYTQVRPLSDFDAVCYSKGWGMSKLYNICWDSDYNPTPTPSPVPSPPPVTPIAIDNTVVLAEGEECPTDGDLQSFAADVADAITSATNGCAVPELAGSPACSTDSGNATITFTVRVSFPATNSDGTTCDQAATAAAIDAWIAENPDLCASIFADVCGDIIVSWDISEASVVPAKARKLSKWVQGVVEKLRTARKIATKRLKKSGKLAKTTTGKKKLIKKTAKKVFTKKGGLNTKVKRVDYKSKVARKAKQG